MIEQLENTILLIRQNGKDWLDERDIPILEEAIQVLKLEPGWIPVTEKLPEEDGRYLVIRQFSKLTLTDVIRYAQNLYKVDKYDFSNNKKAGWYDFDSEYGFYEVTDVVAWMPL